MRSLIKFTSGKQQCSRPSVALRVWRLKVVMAEVLMRNVEGLGSAFNTRVPSGFLGPDRVQGLFVFVWAMPSD